MKTDLFGDPIDKRGSVPPLGRRDHLTFRGNVATGRHGWLRLTPAYSLHLVKTLLENGSASDFVLEPFSGTGTTPLACASMGIPCHAVDINPFLVWIGNLKLQRFGDDTSQELRDTAKWVVRQVLRCKSSNWKPDLHQIEKWWDSPTLGALASLCAMTREASKRARSEIIDLLRVAFCRVMIQSANVSFGHQSMSFKKKGLAPELFEDSNQGITDRLTSMFIAVVSDMADNLEVEPPLVQSRVYQGDSRDLALSLKSESQRYTKVITSPPYPNRMSYIRELRPYMYWLGYLSDGRAAGELDWQAIGGTWGCATSMLNSWTPSPQFSVPFSQFDRIVAEIGKGHRLLGRYVHKYFEDIKSHVLGMRPLLAPSATCHYIVGNSKFYDTLLPVEEIYAAIFEDAGFINVNIETIRKRTSKKELFEFVVNAQMPAAQKRRKSPAT